MTRAQHRPPAGAVARRTGPEAAPPGPAGASSPAAGPPSPTGTAPPRIPTGRAVSAPPPGGRRPVGAARATRPADNRPPGRAGRRPASPAPTPRSTRATSAARGDQRASAARDDQRTSAGDGRPRVGDRAPVRPVVPQPQPQSRPTDRFAELLLAVLSGQRPVHAMLRHTAGRAYDELVRLAERMPLRTRGVRPVVRDIGWFEPREGAIEVFARIGAGDRLRAMAFRLEQGRDLRWRCTAVELGGPRRGGG